MSQPFLAVPIERRERHPYRSLQAELLFQGFRDALDEAEEVATTIHKVMEGRSLGPPTPDGSLGRGSERPGGPRKTTRSGN